MQRDDKLTPKGKKIKRAMTNEYGEEKGERVFYASKNAGKISGVDSGKLDALLDRCDAFDRKAPDGHIRPKRET